MIVCDRCGTKDGVRSIAIGEVSATVVDVVSAFDPAFCGDLCVKCQEHVWSEIREAVKELQGILHE